MTALVTRARGAVPIEAQRRVRAFAAGSGRLTSAWRMRPSFLIIGAQRCGTTSLYKSLAQHPAVLPAVLHKGVHYFDTAYDRGFGWYRGHFPLNATARRVAHRVGSEPITGESSPYYMFHPLAAQRIASDLPDVRLVALLRDPVERAYSAYTHERARGFEAEPSFARALELEPERLAGEEERLRADPHYVSHHHQHNAYLTRGRYAEQLERVAGLVGRDRLHVIDSGDFFTAPADTFDAAIHFLGLPSWRPDTFEQRNARPRTGLDTALRARLDAHFAPYDDALTTWLGHPPSWRR
jgi:hypothetical protein